jgi:hypothetical protein
MKRLTIYIILVLAVIYISCKKQYKPTLVTVSTNALAVDGPIVSGDSTFIRLSRTTSLSDTTQNKAELKAIVSVESDQKALYPLTEKGKGLYVLGVTNFDPARKYRLNIKTNDGKIYQSDFVSMKVTPPIDSIYIKQTDPVEITFYADTHDATNNTRYYRWDYKDTWAYVPIYHTIWKYVNISSISYITPGSPDDLSVCYRWSNSNMLMFGSTAKLDQDVMKQAQLFSVTRTSEKIAHPYVIQLHQYALTKEGFEYYQNLRTNTEQLGSIFDPQPTILKGNIRCINNPSELVIGFISASTVANKQFTLLETEDPIKAYDVNFGDLFKVTRYAYPKPNYEECTKNRDTTKNARPWAAGSVFRGDLTYIEPSVRPALSRALSKGDSILFDIETGLGYIAYFYAPKECVDCRLRFNATNKRPSYYPKIN